MKKIFQKLKDFCEKHKTLIALVVTALFVLSQVPFLVNHEIWSDEAVPWEISKQITPENIYSLNDAEPHPLLWELILAPFSKNNFPIITLNIVSLVIVSISVFLLLRFAPINPFLKLIFLLSNAFFYYNPVIARDYCLIPLAIAFIGLTYKKRHERPFAYSLALMFLSQTHFLMYGLLGVLTLGFIIEEIISKNKARKSTFNILKVIIPLGLSALSLLPVVLGSLNNQAIITGEASESGTYTTFLPNFQLSIFGVDFMALNILALVILALFIIGLFAENFKIAIYTVFSLGFWLITMLFIYNMYFMFEQKTTVLTLIILASVWLLSLEPKNKKENILAKILNFSEIIKFLKVHTKSPATIIVCVLIITTIPNTLVNAFADLDKPFSQSKANAEFLNSLPENTVVIEGDYAAYNQLNVMTLSQLTHKVDVYNITLDRYMDDYSLKYNKEKVEDEKTMSEAITPLVNVLDKFTELSEKYEHIYYMISSNRTSCNNYEGFTPTWLEEYERVTELGAEDYIKVISSPVFVYKIK